MSFSTEFLSEATKVIDGLNTDDIESVANGLGALREDGGRLFILGVGGSAANASHATNDFRKLCNVETYCLTDNVSELTARINDEGWEDVFAKMLNTSRFTSKDGILVFSVGGGNKEKNVSVNLVKAIDYVKEKGGKVFSIIGSADGYAATNSTSRVIIPNVNPTHKTPHSEAFQAVVWHLLVSHPALKKNKTKWEEVEAI